MNKIDWSLWEPRFQSFVIEQMQHADGAHDMEHVRRVVASARRLAELEAARLEVVLPAAWLHDCFSLPKNSPRRAEASTEAARLASDFLTAGGYPDEWIPAIRHAIEAHSFSAGIKPRTAEAKVVRDADRLDAIGAIGIGRCFQVGADLGLAIYHPREPLPLTREPDDSRFVIDHFYVKLLRLVDDMHTAAGRVEAQRRTGFMKAFLQQLESEIQGGLVSGDPPN